MRRRDILIGSACVVAAAAGYALKPRRILSLLGDRKLATIVPRAFGDWSSVDISDQFAPGTDDSLAAKLYGETIGRLYQNAKGTSPITMLMAHGSSQTNELQLHRPEVCYPAFGFTIQSNQELIVPLKQNIGLPSRALIAQSTQSKLATVYWTRLGEYLPISGSEQRLDRMKMAIEGFVPDGLLARFSVETTEPAHAMGAIASFISELVRAVKADARAPLIGSERAALLHHLNV
jgi:EpsI family protein